MNEWIHFLGNQDFYCAGRYKYRIGKVLLTCEVELKFEIEGMNWIISHLSINIIYLRIYVFLS